MIEHRRPIKLLSKENLRDAWDRSRRANKAGAPGIDRVSATTFAENLDSNISRIAKQLQTGEYGFSDLRPVFVAKAGGTKERMICIPTVQDRLVQRAMCWYLDQKQKFPIYNESSFGFVTGRGGTHNAILASLKLRQKFDWCLKTDIEAFFDCIPRNYLLDRIKQELGTAHSFLPLLTKVINCEVKQGLQAEKIRKQKIKLGTGIRQGMPLSPILANLVLSNFDKEIEKRKMNMVRYADDLLFFFTSRKEAEAGNKLVIELLQKLDLKIPELTDGNKTQIVDRIQPIQFLGYELALQDGKFVARISDAQVDSIKLQLVEAYSIQTLRAANISFQESISRLTRSVSAYCGIYKHASNGAQFRVEMKSLGKSIVRKMLEDIFGEDAVSNLKAMHKDFLGIEDFIVEDNLDFSSI